MRVPGQAIQDGGRTLPARVQTIRHHLERTTGPGIKLFFNINNYID